MLFYNHVTQIREEPPLGWYEGLDIFLLPLLKRFEHLHITVTRTLADRVSGIHYTRTHTHTHTHKNTRLLT